MKLFVKQLLNPLRRMAARFVAVDQAIENDRVVRDLSNTIIYKAACIQASAIVEGDYYEFGVFRGDSMVKAYHSIELGFTEQQRLHSGRTEQDATEIKRIWENMRFFAFDSFRGLPRPHDIDKHTTEFAEGKYACSEEEFCQNLKRSHIPVSRIQTIVGWFSDTCNNATVEQHGMKKAAIVHIDCDLYASTKTVLNFVGPLLVDGSIIIFDDWYCFRGSPFLGEQRAFNEWKTELSNWCFTEFQKEGAWRNSFIASKVIP